MKGAPPVARTKTYSAETGYVYQYVYRGYREISDGGDGAEYIFSATRDRKTTFFVTIRLLQAEFAQCAQRIGREILPGERYALAKMTLFDAFDSEKDLQGLQKPLAPDGLQMAEYLRTLGRV